MKIFNKLCLIFIIHSISLNSFAQTDSTSTFEVSGVCGMCKQRIEKAAKRKGVRRQNETW